jgi:hypothetical protein
MSRRLVSARVYCPRMRALIFLLLAAIAAPIAAQKPAPPPPPAKKNPLLKLIEPWPSAEKMRERKADAEALPLFSSADPLQVTIAADFKRLNKDHDPKSRTRYPATLAVGDGAPIDIELRARGHVRRMARTCDYVPIRLEFPKKVTAGGPFAKQEALKLVVQCAGGRDYEQFILREYIAYRIFNAITHSSFRARLARVSYVDRTTGKPAGTRLGIFLEDEGDVAKRMEGRVVELPRLMFEDVAPDSLMPMMIFEYMIGNTDYSIYALHNVRVVQRPDKSLHPVPYDFDISGLVNPPYAVPAAGLMLKSVVDRMYRGPCRRQEQVDPYIANFVAKRDMIMAIPPSVPGIDRQTRDDVKQYLDSFYGSIRNTRDVRNLFVSCTPKPTM